MNISNRTSYTRFPERRRSHKKLVLLVLALAVVIVLAMLGYRHFHSSPATTSPSATKTVTSKAQASDKKTIRLIAAGDMLPHDAINLNAKAGNGYNYQQFFKNVQPFFAKSDIRYCNQESPTASGFGVSGYPTFNAPVQFAQDLSSVGCNLINLANNHADDKGQAGINQTLDEWSKLKPLAVAGTNASAADQAGVHYFTVKGVKFAYLGYAECSNNTGVSSYGLNLLSNKTLVQTQTSEARKHADIVIVGTHWCRENVSTESASQDTWAQYFADQGVDIVIGTGPHWLQPAKQLQKAGGGTTLVWFSLGNFLSAQEEVNGLIGGLAVMDIDVASKHVTHIGFLPTYMHYEWTPQQKASEDLLARKNFMIYPLDKAAAPLARSQNHTTVEAQTERVTKLLNTYTSVPILTSKSY